MSDRTERLVQGVRLNFEIIREGWNTYTFKDQKDVELRARVVLLKAIRTDEFAPSGEPIYATATHNAIASYAPPELRGKPTEPLPSDDKIAALATKELDIATANEVWNEYKLNDGTFLKLKLVISSVRQTSVYGPDGDPIYSVQSSIALGASVPPDLRKNAPPR